MILTGVRQVQSRALRRASWNTLLDTSKPQSRKVSLSRQRRAFVSALYTEPYYPLSLALGYSLQQTNDITSQNAEMVLLVRRQANVSSSTLDKLQQIGWKLRIEDDLKFDNINVENIRPWHKWNLNKLRIWTWTEYDQLLFIDSDALVKGDLSEIWGIPGSILSLIARLIPAVAAAPDAWEDTARDTQFNSGVLLLRPSISEYELLRRAISKPDMHRPEEGDQAFLNRFYEYRYFGLPNEYNLNLVLYEFFPMIWEFLWPRAKIVHFTRRKPMPPEFWCTADCPEKGVLEWYADVFQEMLEFYGLIHTYHY